MKTTEIDQTCSKQYGEISIRNFFRAAITEDSKTCTICGEFEPHCKCTTMPSDEESL